MNFKNKLTHFDTSRPTVENERLEIPNEGKAAIPDHWLQLAELTQGELIGTDSYFYYKKYLVDIDLYPELVELAERSWELTRLEELEPTLKNRNLKLTDILFFDLETTSISGGTGTIAFLIGAAGIFMNQIVIEQMVLPEFSSEFKQLEYFSARLRQKEAIGSFNGKSFDVPILSNRFVLNQMVPEIEDKYHLDLLYPSRRLWSDRLGSCRLQNLEERILGESRIEDVPGELIPGVYFRFSYGEGLDEFRQVLKHNYLDLLNLVRLAAVLENKMQNPFQLNYEEDIASFLRYGLKRGVGKDTLEFLMSCRPEEIPLAALHSAAQIMKQYGYHEKSAQFYEEMILQKVFSDQIIREYCILLEHRLKNYSRAMDLLEKKINRSRIRRMLNTGLNENLPDEWHKRLQRVKKKLKIPTHSNKKQP